VQEEENLYENDILLYAADLWSTLMYFYNAESWPQQCTGLRRNKMCYPHPQRACRFYGVGKGAGATDKVTVTSSWYAQLHCFYLWYSVKP